MEHCVRVQRIRLENQRETTSGTRRAQKCTFTAVGARKVVPDFTIGRCCGFTEKINVINSLTELVSLFHKYIKGSITCMYIIALKPQFCEYLGQFQCQFRGPIRKAFHGLAVQES